MSIETWRKAHYPKSAEEASGSDKEALEHSIVKWRGLRRKAFARHGVQYTLGCLWDKQHSMNALPMGNSTCALCVRHTTNPTEEICVNCPLYKARGNVNCFTAKGREVMSPWHQFTLARDPEPMIRWLIKARKFVAEEKPPQ